jgi:CRISPR-associated protein Cas2
MASNRPRLFLLAYDIADPERLRDVHRTVRRWGLPLQYSVFLIPTSSTELSDLLQELAALIHKRRDDIRVYPLPDRLDIAHYGRQMLPDGVKLVGDKPIADAVAALVGQLAGD